MIKTYLAISYNDVALLGSFLNTKLVYCYFYYVSHKQKKNEGISGFLIYMKTR